MHKFKTKMISNIIRLICMRDYVIYSLSVYNIVNLTVIGEAPAENGKNCELYLGFLVQECQDAQLRRAIAIDRIAGHCRWIFASFSLIPTFLFSDYSLCFS